MNRSTTTIVDERSMALADNNRKTFQNFVDVSSSILSVRNSFQPLAKSTKNTNCIKVYKNDPVIPKYIHTTPKPLLGILSAQNASSKRNASFGIQNPE